MGKGQGGERLQSASGLSPNPPQTLSHPSGTMPRIIPERCHALLAGVMDRRLRIYWLC